MKKILSEATFNELKDRTFQIFREVEMLCEVCEKPLGVRESLVRTIQLKSEEDFNDLMNRASVHDRAEIDVENGKIYFYDHDFPGDVHPECIEKL